MIFLCPTGHSYKKSFDFFNCHKSIPSRGALFSLFATRSYLEKILDFFICQKAILRI